MFDELEFNAQYLLASSSSLDFGISNTVLISNPSTLNPITTEKIVNPSVWTASGGGEIPIWEIQTFDSYPDFGDNPNPEEDFPNGSIEYENIGYGKSNPLTGDWHADDKNGEESTGIFDPDDLSQAVDLGQLDELTHFSDRVDFSHPNDFYRFEIEGEQQTSFLLYGLEGDADLNLVHDRNENGRIDDGELIDYSGRGYSQAEEIDRILEDGTYYLNVTYWSGDTDYHLQLNATPTIPTTILQVIQSTRLSI
ncbi:MAG: hypothetical protein J7641_13825 [Cyanobacteria bacterium SID2]|nr:hypothetical protein [Cyanobacteria bacterium SID2]MBP0002820.1 hypothetical protein [Cyanobacteria bacterium SBC]